MGDQSQDEQLARRCVSGDELAWRELIDRYTPMVYSLCVHAGLGAADAEDVCQEAMVPIGLSDEPPLQGLTPCTAPTQERELTRAGDRERVREGLHKLADPTRSVMLAYYLARMPVREVAHELEMPQNTVKSHLRRGRQALRANLEEA